MSRRASIRKRENQKKRHALPKRLFTQHADPEARGILAQVANALKIVEALPQSTIIIIPPPTPAGLLQRLLAEQNRS